MTARERRVIASQLRDFEAAVRTARASVKAGRGYHIISEDVYLRMRADVVVLDQIGAFFARSKRGRR